MADGVRLRWFGPPLLAVLLGAGPVQAQIVTDGTVGRKVSLSGGKIEIGADLGTQKGANLFHSFEKFGIAPGQTATFTGPGTVKNVISRVTGGEASKIDGTLASRVGQANLYFLNPAGVMFGPNAKLDVPGSFHVSTAQELRFADGARFSAVDKTGSGLTVAAPEAFGFLDQTPGRITVDQSQLQLTPAKTFSLVGGDIDISGGTIAVKGGSPVGSPNAGALFKAVSVASPGAVGVSGGSVDAAKLGSVRIANQQITTSGNGGGSVRIRAGALTVANSAIDADNTGDLPAIGGIDLMAGNLAVTDSRISTTAESDGPGGTVAIKADTMTVRNTTAAGVPERRGIHSDTRSAGSAGTVAIQAGSLTVSGIGAGIKSDALDGSTGIAGSVEINAKTLELYSGGDIGSDTFSSGPAGSVTVQADRMFIDGSGPFGFTGLSSSTFRNATGNGGEINVKAHDLELRDGGTLSTVTYNRGNGGQVTVEVKGQLTVAGFNRLPRSIVESQISSRAQGSSTGQGGTVQVTAGTLDVRDGGVIDSDSNGTGLAGNISINADRVTVANASTPRMLFTRISSRGNTNSEGSGNVEVKARDLELRDGGVISTTSLSGRAGRVIITADKLLISGKGVDAPDEPSGISTVSNGSSQGAGTVRITATELEMRNGGEINTQSFGNANGGSLVVTIKDRAGLDNVTIRAEAAASAGGNVILSAGRLFDLNNSTVTTSVTGGSGSGGNIVVNSPLVVFDNMKIIANAQGGSGGNITIRANQLIRTPDSVLQASSAQSVAGNIVIIAPNTDVADSLVVLPETFLDASRQLRETCASRGGRPSSSFIAHGRGGLPPDPGAPLAANPFEQQLDQQADIEPPPALTPQAPQQAAKPAAVKPVMVAGTPQPVLGSPRFTCRASHSAG